MPSCTLCGGSEFLCHNGLYYCAECDTQSQDFVQAEAAEINEEDVTFGTKRLVKKTKTKESISKGLPWTSLEGFQLIIKENIRILIEMGFDPKLDEVVREMWFWYLEKSGLANMFNIIKKEQGKTSTFFRDYFIKHYKKDILPSMVKIRASKRAKWSDKKESQLVTDQEWFSVDTEVSSADGNVNDQLEDNGCKIPEYIKKKFVWRAQNQLCFLKIFCILYLALQWCREHVTIGDFLYWMESGTLSYYGAIDSFPSHMKISSYDYKIFGCPKPLDYNKFEYLSNQLVTFLDMPPILNLDVMHFVVRYLTQLNLPLAVASLARSLSSRINYEIRSSGKLYKRPLDHFASALIIVCLKLLFTLDDDTEWLDDEEVSECPLHKEDEDVHHCHMFTWKAWKKEQTIDEEYKLQNEYTLFDRSDVDSTMDVHCCMENQGSVIMKGSNKAVHHQKDSKNASAKVHQFTKLVSLQGSDKVKENAKRKRLSSASRYQMFGHRNGIDFTPACIAILMENMKKKRVGYIKYDPAYQDIENYHHSHKFLLKLVSKLTYVHANKIQNCVFYVENCVIDGFLE